MSTCRGHWDSCHLAIHLPQLPCYLPLVISSSTPSAFSLVGFTTPLKHTPLWRSGPLPSPSAPAHRAGSSPDPSSPSGPLRSGETKASVSQSGPGGPSQPYPRRLQSSPGNFLAHSPAPTSAHAWPWLPGFFLLPSRGHSPAGLRRQEPWFRETAPEAVPSPDLRQINHDPHWTQAAYDVCGDPLPSDMWPHCSPGLLASLPDGLNSVDCS